MIPPRPHYSLPAPVTPAQEAARQGLAAARSIRPIAAIDWPGWQRATERNRRLVARLDDRATKPFRAAHALAATDSSFRLEGLVVPPIDLAAALSRGWSNKTFRPRQQQRVRNHVAILRHIDKLIGEGGTLKSDDVVRWYTSVACGLSTTALDDAATSRLDGIVRQINSPHLRLAPAVQGIARLHHQLLSDPVVPSFNGILARLLLHYHLARCGLPPVLFDAEISGTPVPEEPRFLAQLLEMIDQAYRMLLRKQP